MRKRTKYNYQAERELKMIARATSYIFIIVFCAISLLALLFIGTKPTVDEQTKRDCLYGANIAKEAFSGTRFEDWNFYESCLLNVVCSNPEKVCPTNEIHEQSLFFVRS